MKGLEELAAKWDREAKQYRAQIEECRAKGLDFDCMLGTKTALEQCAKELRQELKNWDSSPRPSPQRGEGAACEPLGMTWAEEVASSARRHALAKLSPDDRRLLGV